MCVENDFLRLSTKTPALLLTKEAKMTIWRKKYVKTLLDRIEKGKLKIKYLFSTQLTRSIILKERDFAALRRLEAFVKTSGIKMKHAPLHSVITMAISDKEYMIGFASPSHTNLVGILHVIPENTKDMCNIYDNIFSNAFEPIDFIREMENLLKGNSDNPRYI
jgi:hypothetical protein